MNESTNDTWESAPPADLRPAPPPAPGGLRRRTAAAATILGLTAGGLVGGYMVTRAATSTPSPSATPTGGQDDHPGDRGGPDGGARLGGAGDAAEDRQTIATAIGISTTQLQTELQSDGTIAAVAKAHGVDPARVVAALVAAKDKEIDAALGAGQITQAQAAQMKADAQQQATDQVNGTGRGPGGPGGHGPGGLQSEDLTLVAGALGITASELQTDLGNGQTIAAVAKARNVDVSKVISAWVASENAEIDARVSAGQETAAQAAQDKQETTQRVTDQVDGTFRGGPGGPGGHDHGGPDDGGAPAPGSTSSGPSA